MRNRSKMASQVLVGLAVVAFGSLGLASAASAAGAPGQPDGQSTGSLTIHKYVGADDDFTGDGSPVTIEGKSPLAGVTFTAYPITSRDLTEQSDWVGLTDLVPVCDPAPSVAGETLGIGTDIGPTNPSGTATANLAVGAYLVCETGAPANVTQRSAPFIVTVPMNNGEAGWRYDVHAYPKNLLEEGEAEKTVDDSTAVIEGDEVSWTVSSKFQNAPVDSFVMTDVLDSRLEYVAGSIVVTATMPDSTTQDVTDLFTTTLDAVTNTLTASANDPAGLAALNGLPAGYMLTFAFDTKVLATGIIENMATVGGTVTNVVDTRWGDIEVTKTDADNAALLDGAEFAIYAGACPVADDATVIETITTAGGVATSSALKEGSYCFVETKAPAGYVDPTFTATVAVVAGEEDSTTEVEVENVKQEVPGLPITGSTGMTAMMLGGGALAVLGGVIAGAAARKRRASH